MEEQKKIIVPVENKYALTIDEAAEYTGIGINRLRQLVRANPGEPWILNVGSHYLIKREIFVRYLDKIESL